MYKILAPAPTLKDLIERLQEAQEIVGPNAIWNGYDDESVNIYSQDDSICIRITPD